MSGEAGSGMLAWVEREVRACRGIGMRYFRSARLRVERKADGSPVTAADRRIEERLRRAIGRAFPGEPIVGEEGGSPARVGKTFWTIDPIDGTRAFSRGLPTWGILVARVEEGRPTMGVCDFPALGVTIGVAPGVPAYERRGRAVRRLKPPPPVTRLEDAVLLHGGMRWWPRSLASGLTRVARACYLERAFGDCSGYLWALRGQADVVMDFGVKVWDVAPLAALAEATGRVLTDFQGRPCWTGPQALFGSPSIARQIVQILKTPRRSSLVKRAALANDASRETFHEDG